MNVSMIRTIYPHRESHSGFNQLANHLDKIKYNIETYDLTDGDEDFWIQNSYVRGIIKRYVEKRGLIWNNIHWYKLNDLVAEVTVFAKSIFSNYDIIHFLEAEHTALYLPKLLNLLPRNKPKLIGTFHQHPDILKSANNKDLIPLFDAITLVSEEQFPFFNQYTSSNKIHVIPHGVDTEFFRPSNENQKCSKFKCITFGHWQRDFITLREVCSRLYNYENIEFHVISSSCWPKNLGLEELRNVVIYKDHIDDMNMLKLYQTADILFLPLLLATANNNLLEGLACGLPVVASLLPSVKYYVPGDEAKLIKNNNPEQFAYAILELYFNPFKLKIMKRNARTRAKELDWRIIASAYEKVYNGVQNNTKNALPEE